MVPNKLIVIRNLILKQARPFCRADLYSRLANEGIQEHSMIDFVLNDLIDNENIVYTPDQLMRIA